MNSVQTACKQKAIDRRDAIRERPLEWQGPNEAARRKFIEAPGQPSLEGERDAKLEVLEAFSCRYLSRDAWI